MNTENKVLGKVILAGAGPGDPDLISVKALRYLKLADVVIVDRLVSEELLVANVKPGSKIIRAGKQGGSASSTGQQTINDLLVEHAKTNALVLRLKGGDVSFFSNVLDELETLTKYGIDFEVVPGITAASGAAAYAGFPLTARGYANSVRFITHYGDVKWTPAYWNELTSTEDTLVFYMSMEFLDTLVENLLLSGISPDKQLAVISEATTPFQRVQVLPLPEYNSKRSSIRLTSPTIIVVGKVTVLHKRFNWFTGTRESAGYFNSKENIVPVNLN
ncbi:MAG TPA: uroporphyrinogen-III C-methyltransferase [Cyclobacteriaceae bacterium]|nr:uroporphyrinogen-III C-methyltransferase [Cyclobacteriaceae bacterium]